MPSTTSRRGLERLGLFDRDHAVLADLGHGVGDDLADRLVAVGRDGADLGDLVARHRLGHRLEPGDDGLDGEVDAALEVHRVGAGGDVLGAFAHDRLGQHRRGGGAVTGDVRGLAGDLADEARAEVLDRVLEVDFLGDGDAVLGDGRRTELAVDDDVAALRPEGDLDRVGELVDAAQERRARLLVEDDLLGCHVVGTERCGWTI